MKYFMTLLWGPAHDSPWETKPNEEGGNLQECKVLEDLLGTSVLAQCLSRPHDAPKIVREHRSIILK